MLSLDLKGVEDIKVGRMPNGIESSSPSTLMKADRLKTQERRVKRSLDKSGMFQSRDVHLATGLPCSCGWESAAGKGSASLSCTLCSFPGARGHLLTLPIKAEWACRWRTGTKPPGYSTE